MGTERSTLIRLASNLPKGSQERRAILEGLKKKAVDSFHSQLLPLKALQELGRKADLPVKFTNYESHKFKIPVPEGFDSLFKEVLIEVQVSTRDSSATVSWQYVHPGNIGSNGLTLGWIGFDSKTQRWSWRTQSPRADFGYVE